MPSTPRTAAARTMSSARLPTRTGPLPAPGKTSPDRLGASTRRSPRAAATARRTRVDDGAVERRQRRQRRWSVCRRRRGPRTPRSAPMRWRRTRARRTAPTLRPPRPAHGSQQAKVRRLPQVSEPRIAWPGRERSRDGTARRPVTRPPPGDRPAAGRHAARQRSEAVVAFAGREADQDDPNVDRQPDRRERTLQLPLDTSPREACLWQPPHQLVVGNPSSACSSIRRLPNPLPRRSIPASSWSPPPPSALVPRPVRSSTLFVGDETLRRINERPWSRSCRRT